MKVSEQKRNEVEELLKVYGAKSFHREESRVRLGVLYLPSKELERLVLFLNV